MPRLLTTVASLLVLPLAALLFLQWPLREVVQSGSRQANDLAQVIFAVYMAVAIWAATRAGTHLSAAHGSRPAGGGWRSWAVAACLSPWAIFLLWSSAASVWQSIAQQERFSETLTPGYFAIKAALWLMAVLVLLQSVRDMFRQDGPG